MKLILCLLVLFAALVYATSEKHGWDRDDKEMLAKYRRDYFHRHGHRRPHLHYQVHRGRTNLHFPVHRGRPNLHPDKPLQQNDEVATSESNVRVPWTSLKPADTKESIPEENGQQEEPVREVCGNHVCNANEYCCNPSCGICVTPGMVCIQIACGDGNTPFISAETK